MLEAAWDPVAGKVVFKDPSKTNQPEPPLDDTKPKSDTVAQRDHQNKSNNDDEDGFFAWRDDDNDKTSEQQASTCTNNKRRSRGVSVDKFYRPNAATKQLHVDIQNHVVEYQSSKLLNLQTIQRRAFGSMSVYKTFPLQELAVSKLRQLRVEWGVPETELILDDPDDEPSIQRTYSGDSLHSGSSLEPDPEAKRFFRGKSPSQSRHYQQFRTQLLQQQSRPPHQTDPTVFGSAYYCLEPRVFGMESSTNGKRKYVTASVGKFMDTYWRTLESKHCYELIRPDAHTRLYLDIEANLKNNPDLQAKPIQEQLLDELYQELRVELELLYPQHTNTPLAPLQRIHIVDLNASRPGKFSRHWIVHLPTTTTTTHTKNPLEALFMNNRSVGEFMKAFIGRLANDQGTGVLRQRHPTLDRFLFVQTDSKSCRNNVTCLVDLGVYSRNRLFRLLGSWKFGKPSQSALRIADACTFPFPGGFGNACFYNIPNDANNLDIDDQVQKSVARFDWKLHAQALAETFVVPINCAKIDYPILDLHIAEKSSQPQPAMRTQKPTTALSLSRGTSPYPMVDDFVLSELAIRGGTQGTIRAYSVDYDNQKPIGITYQMLRNRWCENIGRQHKSNNIAWHVDFRLRKCYQTCHDPDCRTMGFRGAPVELPDAVWDDLEDLLFEEDLKQLEVARPKIFDDDDDSFEQALSALNLNVPSQATNVSTNDTKRESPTEEASKVPFRIDGRGSKASQIPVAHDLRALQKAQKQVAPTNEGQEKGQPNESHSDSSSDDSGDQEFLKNRGSSKSLSGISVTIRSDSFDREHAKEKSSSTLPQETGDDSVQLGKAGTCDSTRPFCSGQSNDGNHSDSSSDIDMDALRARFSRREC